jgi:RNA polymerase sigma-70 factor (ECF subfamily)
MKPNSVTKLLQEYSEGDEHALEELLPQVYRELRRLAGSYMKREKSNHTLQPTALVHEAFIKLVDQREVQWQSKAHFFAMAASIMRRILLDHARAKKTAKRGGGSPANLEFDDGIHLNEENGPDLLALDEALTRLSAQNEMQGRIVELRYFGGLSIEETANALEISPATVKRHWTLAKSWLQKELSAESTEDSERGERHGG